MFFKSLLVYAAFCVTKKTQQNVIRGFSLGTKTVHEVPNAKMSASITFVQDPYSRQNYYVLINKKKKIKTQDLT